MNEPQPVAPTAVSNLTLPRIRTIAAITTLGSITVGVAVLIVLMVSVFPSVLATSQNLERVSEAMAVSAENLADVSDETALNLVEMSANLNAAAASFNRASSDFERNSAEDGIAETIMRVLEENRQGDNR